MASDDVLLSVISGLSKGFAAGYIPIKRAQEESRLTQERALQERELRRVDVPPDLAGELGIPSLPTDPEVLSSATTLAGRRGLREQQLKTGKIYTLNKRTGKLKQVGETSPGTGDIVRDIGMENEEEKQTIRAQAKIEKEKPKAIASAKDTLREYDNMINEALDIRNDPALKFATGIASPLGGIPGTPSKRVASRLETLKAKTLLNVLTSLKTLSTTGATGFGQLNIQEAEAIKSSVSTLDRKLQKGDFQDSIDRFIKEIKARKNTIADTTLEIYGVDLTKQEEKKDGIGQPSLEQPSKSSNGMRFGQTKSGLRFKVIP